MSKRAKWVTLGTVLALIAGVGAMSAAKKGQKATEVRIESAEKRDLVASVTASGQVQPRTKVDVVADIPSPGRILRLVVEEGQMVSKGQFLLQIDPAQYEAAVQRAEAGLASARAEAARAKANLVQAQRAYERTAEIKKQNAQLVSDEQVEQLRTQMEVSTALLDASNHSVDQSTAL